MTVPHRGASGGCDEGDQQGEPCDTSLMVCLLSVSLAPLLAGGVRCHVGFGINRSGLTKRVFHVIFVLKGNRGWTSIL